MTVRSTSVIYCDGPPDRCPLRGGAFVFAVINAHEFRSPDHARSAAAVAGWTRPTRRLDLCPVCSAAAS